MNSPENEDRSPLSRWERVSSETEHEYMMFHTRRDGVLSPEDGTEHSFDIIVSPEAVTVVALTPSGEFVLVEQFRHGTREVVLEMPGGVMDEGESPLECGPRELLEETGFSGSEPEMLGTVALNPSWQTTRVHVVRVRDAERVSGKDLDEFEDTRVRLMPLDELLARVRDGTFDTAVGLAALALHRWGGENAGR